MIQAESHTFLVHLRLIFPVIDIYNQIISINGRTISLGLTKVPITPFLCIDTFSRISFNKRSFRVYG